MTISRYLLRSYLYIAAMLIVSGIASKPMRAASEYGGFLLMACLITLFPLTFVAALANATPAERRLSFWSFRWSNYVMLYPLGIATLLLVVLALFGIEDAT